MMREPYEEQFARFQQDIAEHTVTVLREDGLYRHLRCRRDDSYTYGFDIVTWPGYLAYTGDMGTYVFSRLPDMFGFFRARQQAVIDRGYLAEKAVAVDKPDGLRAYSEDLFRAAVKGDYDSFLVSHTLTVSEAQSLWQAIEDQVLSNADSPHDAVRAAVDFVWPIEGRVAPVFPDFWGHRLETLTLRFWWCCYAIPWAIAQYDGLKDVESGKRRPDFAPRAVRAKETPDGTGTPAV
jgi:hypothetical protein